MLESFLLKNNISTGKASKDLKLTINDLLEIIISRKRPDIATKVRIATWTRGYVPTSSWGNMVQRESMPMHLLPPKTREDCVDGERPCPYFACRYHLWNDIKLRHMPESLPDETCALDVADEGEHTLLDISYFLILTRERVRQIEHIATNKLSRRLRIMKED